MASDRFPLEVKFSELWDCLSRRRARSQGKAMPQNPSACICAPPAIHYGKSLSLLLADVVKLTVWQT